MSGILVVSARPSCMGRKCAGLPSLTSTLCMYALHRSMSTELRLAKQIVYPPEAMYDQAVSICVSCCQVVIQACIVALRMPSPVVTHHSSVRRHMFFILQFGPAKLFQVFDPSSRGVLRQFKAHKRAVHVTRFSPDKLHVLSGSDDVTARCVRHQV